MKNIDNPNNQNTDFIQIILRPDMKLMDAMGIASAAEHNSFQTVVKILDAFERLVPLMSAAISREVNTTQDQTTLFRGFSRKEKKKLF